MKRLQPSGPSFCGAGGEREAAVMGDAPAPAVGC